MNLQRLVPSEYAYVFFVCEGKNEETVLNWVHDTGNLSISNDTCSLDYTRKARTKRGKRSLIQRCLEHDYGGKVAIVYLLDSKQEQWRLTVEESKRIDILMIYTSPEIEYLLVLMNSDIEQEWQKQHRQNKRLKVSEFCEGYFGGEIKNGQKFIDQFSSFQQFIESCEEYKSRNNDQEFFLRDIIRECPL